MTEHAIETSQFLSRDPAVSLTRSPYGYVGGNPLNSNDPSGLWGLPDLNPVNWVKAGAGTIGNAASWTWEHVGKPVAYVPLEAASLASYGEYWLGYQTNRALEGLPWWGQVLTAPARPAAWAAQGFGLRGDVAIDAIRNVVLQNGEACNDEQQPGYVGGSKLGPWLQNHGIGNHVDYLPGWGQHGVDWAW